MPHNLYKRGDVWWARITVAGKEHRRSLRTGNRRIAESHFEAWKAELSSAAFFGIRRLTWKEAVIRFSTEVIPNSIKASTATRYLVSLRQVRPTLDTKFLDQINRTVITELVATRRASGAGNATINRDLTAVSAVLEAAIEWGACHENAAATFNRKKNTRERRERVVIPTDEAVNAVIARAPGLFSDLIRFLALEGCRQEEAAGLEWPQVSLSRGEVTYLRTKSSRARTVQLSEAGRLLLERLPRALKCPHVFWHSGGTRYANVSSRFAEIRRSAGQTFRCHDLRHRYAVMELQNGRDIYDLCRHLGHSSVKVTERYLGYVPGYQGGEMPERPRNRTGQNSAQ